MGVACFCNTEKVFECLIIFGKNIKVKNKAPAQIDWPNVMDA